MSGSIEITSGSESDLQSCVANVGPVSVAVDASNNAFRVRKLNSRNTATITLSCMNALGSKAQWLKWYRDALVTTSSSKCYMIVSHV